MIGGVCHVKGVQYVHVDLFKTTVCTAANRLKMLFSSFILLSLNELFLLFSARELI